MPSPAYQVVREFEKEIANYAGADWAVAVESGSAALFLSCVYCKVGRVIIPSRTYVSVPNAIIHAGGTVRFVDKPWEGIYELRPYGIIDGALRFKRGMFAGRFHCLSFHAKKHLPIGRGGMILGTWKDEDAYDWFRKARFDGRSEVPMEQDNITMLGWNMYLQPEQAARGLQIFDMIKTLDLPDLSVDLQKYPDLSRFNVYGG